MKMEYTLVWNIPIFSETQLQHINICIFIHALNFLLVLTLFYYYHSFTNYTLFFVSSVSSDESYFEILKFFLYGNKKRSKNSLILIPLNFFNVLTFQLLSKDKQLLFYSVIVYFEIREIYIIVGAALWLSSKEYTSNTREAGWIPGLGRSPLEDVQYSCLGNPMDKGVWWAAVQGVTK